MPHRRGALGAVRKEIKKSGKSILQMESESEGGEEGSEISENIQTDFISPEEKIAALVVPKKKNFLSKKKKNCKNITWTIPSSPGFNVQPPQVHYVKNPCRVCV